MRRLAFLAVLLVANTTLAQQPKQVVEFNMINDVFMEGSPFPGSMKTVAHYASDGVWTRMDIMSSPAMGRGSSMTMLANRATHTNIMLDRNRRPISR